MYHNDYNIWSVLKNCIGKELSKITMPVVFNEPLSFLQRMAEYMEYSHLLRLASEQEDPAKRMQYVIGQINQTKYFHKIHKVSHFRFRCQRFGFQLGTSRETIQSSTRGNLRTQKKGISNNLRTSKSSSTSVCLPCWECKLDLPRFHSP